MRKLPTVSDKCLRIKIIINSTGYYSHNNIQQRVYNKLSPNYPNILTVSIQPLDKNWKMSKE